MTPGLAAVWGQRGPLRCVARCASGGLLGGLPLSPRLLTVLSLPPQAGLIEANGELKVFIDQNLSPGKGKGARLGKARLWISVFSVGWV